MGIITLLGGGGNRATVLCRQPLTKILLERHTLSVAARACRHSKWPYIMHSTLQASFTTALIIFGQERLSCYSANTVPSPLGHFEGPSWWASLLPTLHTCMAVLRSVYSVYSTCYLHGCKRMTSEKQSTRIQLQPLAACPLQLLFTDQKWSIWKPCIAGLSPLPPM